MKKAEYISRYGEEAYKRELERNRIQRRKKEAIARYGEEEYKRRLKRNTKEAVIARYGEEEYKRRLERDKKVGRKEEYIARHGEDAWERHLGKKRTWKKAHPEQRWDIKYPEKAKALQRESCRKGGKHYEKRRERDKKGLRHERILIRNRHRKEFHEIKDTLAVEVELHHEWIGDTTEYRGMAFVEKVAHRNGIIDVILLLDGEITIYDFTGTSPFS